MTIVCHCKKEQYDEYIGRGSILGNPFTHLPLHKTKAMTQVATRDESIERYREYAIERMKTDPAFRAAIKRCKGKRIGCYCRTSKANMSKCHGDIVAELAEVA